MNVTVRQFCVDLCNLWPVLAYFWNMQLPDLYDLYLQNPSVQTDTRKLKPGDIYFALKGPSYNGNQFARQALDAGAAYAVVDEPVNFSDERIITTEYVLHT